MGLDDIRPGMKAKVIMTDVQTGNEFHCEVKAVGENCLKLVSGGLSVDSSRPCNLCVTVGNVMYCWKDLTITDDLVITVNTQPEILNRRKYPRMDLSNNCTIKLKGTDTTFKGTLDNISANGFAFLTKDPYFVDHKGAKVTISIEDFALADHSVLEGYVIRCSNNEGTYIVGCQMPEDNYYIQTYVNEQLRAQLIKIKAMKAFNRALIAFLIDNLLSYYLLSIIFIFYLHDVFPLWTLIYTL